MFADMTFADFLDKHFSGLVLLVLLVVFVAAGAYVASFEHNKGED